MRLLATETRGATGNGTPVTRKDSEPGSTVSGGSPLDCCSQGSINGSKYQTDLHEDREADKDRTLSFAVNGMRCVSCAREIEKTLKGIPGVKTAQVHFFRREAMVNLKQRDITTEELRSAVEAKGYRLVLHEEEKGPGGQGAFHNLSAGMRSCLTGLAVSAGVVGFYLGLLTLTSDWYNAKLDFEEYGIWILALALGLGVQVTLFSLYRAWHRGESAKAAKYSLAASGGMSTTAMAACCAHYLAVILPALGLPFLSAAAAGLARYQVYFFMAGVISNMIGIGIMIRMMRRNGMIQWQFSMSRIALFWGKVNNKGGI